MFNDTTMLGAGNSAAPAPTEVYQALCDGSAPFTADVPNERPAAFRAPLGEWFDIDLDFIGPEGDAFTDSLLAAIEAVEQPRGRARRPIDAANHRTFVRKLAANGFRAFRYHNPPLVAVRRKGDGYRGRAPWLSGKAMKRETILLQRTGLIEVSDGKQGEASTTYRVTDAFLIAAMKARISERNLIHRLPPERLVRVYKTNGKHGELVDFNRDGEARQWIEQADAYQGFVAQQQIGIDLSKAETALLTARMNHERPKGTPRLVRPDLIRKGLFRQFNNGSFEAGGRLYGAWWINCPKDLRPLITINGKPTVELDFSGCAIRMLYHEDKEECEGEPYFLDAIDACERENGLPKEHFREDVKRMTQALINGREGGYAERIKLPPRHTFKPYFTRPEVMAMIRAKHARIAHTFQTGAWGRLQRADSDIALEVITNLREQGIVALPVHDSFVIAQGEEGALRQEMMDCYFNRFTLFPVIKRVNVKRLFG